MPPFPHNRISKEDGASVISLPTELRQEIAKWFSTDEWVRTCGSVCRAFHDLQPQHIEVYVAPGSEGHAALRWAARHWQQAVTLDLHLGHFREQDTLFFGDLTEVLTEAPEAAVAQSVTVTVDPQVMKPQNLRHLAAYLESCLQCHWKNIVDLDLYVDYLSRISPLHKLRTLHLSMMAFYHYGGLMASIRSLAQLEQLHIRSVGEGLFQPDSFDVGCLACLDTLVLDRIIPKAVNLPSGLKMLQVTGNAGHIESATWLNSQVPLRALGLKSMSPISGKLESLLHDMRHSPLEKFDLESTCRPFFGPVQHFSMGCVLDAATSLPHFHALKSMRIFAHGNVSIVIPAESAIQELWLRADRIDISMEGWSSFAARMQSVTLFYNQVTGAGFTNLQTLHTSGDCMVKQHAFCNQSAPESMMMRLFSARRIVEGENEPNEYSSTEEESDEDADGSEDDESSATVLLIFEGMKKGTAGEV